MPANSHCPGCGLSRLAVQKAIENADGSWACSTCATRGGDDRKPANYTPITCPECRGGDAACTACGGLGKVRVSTDQLRVYSPATKPRMLTEG